MAANTGTYGKNYEELSLDAARRAERIACSLRNLIYAADLVPKPILMEAAAQVHGISIKHTLDCVEITLPGLMPKRTKRINTTFLTDPLYPGWQHRSDHAETALLPGFAEGTEKPAFVRPAAALP